MPQEYIYSKKYQEGVHFEQEAQFAEPPHSLKDAVDDDHLVRKSQLAGFPTTNDILLDVVDIRAYGGIPDGVFDNSAALVAAKAAVNPGGLIWFKNRGVGIYKFESVDYANLFTGCKIFVEDGVKMEVVSPNYLGINVTTPTVFQHTSLAGQLETVYPKKQSPLFNSNNYQSLRDNVVVREPVLAADFVEREVVWPGTVISTNPANLTVVSPSEATLTAIGANDVKVATVPAKAGQTISCFFANPVLPIGDGVLHTMWIENAWGFLIAHESSVGFTVQFNEFGGAGPTYYRNTSDIINAEGYENYSNSKGIVSIHLLDDGKTFEFLHNGVNRSKKFFTLGNQPVVRWGFGGYNTPVTIKNFFIEYNRKPASHISGIVQIFGDSQSVELMGKSWIDHFKNYVKNNYGFRDIIIENYAVSGATMEAQEGVFGGVAHSDVSIFLLGTNNIQAQSSVASMITSLDNMVTVVGKENVIVCIPPMFFSQALNGGQGQACVNYDLGGLYRSAIFRYAAENDIMIVDLPAAWGFTSAYSEQMCDDIHPADLGAAITGMEIALKYMALVTRQKANYSVIGDSRSSYNWVNDTTVPVDAVTVAKYFSIFHKGEEFKIKAFQ